MPSDSADRTTSEKKSRDLTAEAIKRLGPKLQSRPCPMCDVRAGWNAEVLGVLITPLGGGITLGAHFPTVVLTCKNCGFVSLHALGALGLAP